MKTWNNAFVGTLPYLNGLGFMNEYGNLMAVTLDTSKEIPVISVLFIPLNTTEKFERLDKRGLKKLFDNLGLGNMFSASVKNIIKYSTIEPNIEVRSWPDVDGYFYELLKIKHENVEEEFGSIYNDVLLNFKTYENSPIWFEKIKEVIKHNENDYTVAGFNCEVTITKLPDNTVIFYHKMYHGTVISVTSDKVHSVLSRLKVKAKFKENLMHSKNYLVSSDKNKMFNEDIFNKLEKAYAKQLEAGLSTGKKLSLQVKKAKEQNNPFAVLKTLL